MLEEFKKFRQVEEITRRLFADNYFDLYVWYKKNTSDFIGFQLVFSVNGIQMALTAEVGKVPDIHKVESGDGEFYSPTDLLDGVGYFPKYDLYEEFKLRSENVDKYIRENVLNVIKMYKVENCNKLKLSEMY